MSKLRESAQAVLHAIENGHPNGTQGMDATLDALHEALREHALVLLTNTHQQLDAALEYERKIGEQEPKIGEQFGDDIIRMAREAGFGLIDDDLIDYFERFAVLVAAAEREACAQICDDHADDPVYCGLAIRARGQE